jgi:hypothetical protein
MMQMQAMMSKMMPGVSEPMYDRNLEIATIGIGIVNFVVCIFYPTILGNTFINWFSETIHGIYEAPIIGFIFKVIGFFFLVSIIFKGVTSIGRALGLLPPPPETNANFDMNMFTNMQNGPFGQGQNPFGQQDQDDEDKDDDGFDKYEEVDDGDSDKS